MQWPSLVFLLLLLYQSLTFASFTIMQKPIIWNASRVKLTRDYQRIHYGIQSCSINIEPKIIVLHWTATASLSEAFNTLNPAKLASQRSELPGELNVSAHFLVDRDGRIYQLMPDNWMARHVIGLNHYAIGIENVGGVASHPHLTEAQAQSNAYLVRYLKKKYTSIQYVIGHMNYLELRKTPLWLEKDPHYHTIKQDPGEAFVRRVKELSGRI